MQNTEVNPPETSFRPSRSEWEKLLNRVVESTPFRRSSRLREFLIYVGNEVIVKGVENLPEQQIGMAVFGRSPAYDTSQDNIVRVNAMELRKRIDLYFANEGQNEPLVFEIPRGSYSPVFRVRRQSSIGQPLDEAVHVEKSIGSAAQSIEEPQSPAAGRRSSRTWALDNPFRISLFAIMVCLSTWLTIEVRRNQQTQLTLHRWQSGPAMRDFWGNFFGQKLAPEIVLADTSFGIAQDVLHKQLSLAEYLDYSYRATQSTEPLSSEARQQEQKDLAVIFNRSSGSIGDFRVARRITELETGDYGTRLSFAREYAGHRVRWSNTIFVGSNRSNPWVDLFEDKMAYHFKQSQDSTLSYVAVDSPTGNEQAQYTISPDPGTRTAYCVIVFLPNPTNTGNTLIVAGTDSQATEAGGDFITSEDSLQSLRALMHQKTFPYFQILLRISRFNGTPLGSQIISYRITKK